ncbi:MAG: enoyl-CoA hydratase/isomerase family protein [bacterium]
MVDGGGAPASAPRVLVEIAPPVATLRFNRPERLNALTEHCREEFLAALAHASAREDVHVVVVTGAGRAFCSGGDLDRLLELREAGDTAGFARILDGQLSLTRALRALPQIAIAAVNGPCGGAGLDVALACDLRFAAESATFGAPFLRLGILPDATALALLPLAVGYDRSLEMFLEARFVSAEEARAQGLVSRVVPDADLLPHVHAFAARTAARPRELVASLKQILDDARRVDWSVDAHRAAQLRAFDAPASLDAIRAARRTGPGAR